MTGFWTLFKRESLRFLTLPNQTLLPSAINVFLYVIVFGHIIGSQVKEVQGFSFIEFVFPGLVMMGTTTSAFQNTATTLFIARWEQFIDDLLVAPVTYFQMVCAFTLSAVLRGVLVGLICFCVGFLFGEFTLVHPFLFLVSVVSASFCFAGIGLINGLFAKRWDHIAVFQNYIITPFVFLGGVFYSMQMLPESMQWMSFLNPLFYMVSIIRYACIGYADIPFYKGLMVTLTLGSFFFLIALELFRRGVNLRT